MRNLIIGLLFLTLANSCKKDDSTIYEPTAKKVIGTWQLTSLYSKASGVNQTYPNAMRATTVTFSDSAAVRFVLPCNSGSATCVIDENGGFVLSHVSTSALFCSASENDLEDDVLNAITNTYWLDINGTQLRMVSVSGYYNLNFTKL